MKITKSIKSSVCEALIWPINSDAIAVKASAVDIAFRRWLEANGAALMAAYFDPRGVKRAVQYRCPLPEFRALWVASVRVRRAA